MYKKFKLEITMGNDAMQEPFHVIDALEQVKQKIYRYMLSGKIIDGNGNTVGSFEFKSNMKGR